MARAANGYTDKDHAQMAQFVRDFKADPRTWQERIIDNARPEERAALAEYLGVTTEAPDA